MWVVLLQVIKYESIIHEFDPYFNYRVTQVCCLAFNSVATGKTILVIDNGRMLVLDWQFGMALSESGELRNAKCSYLS